MIISSYLHLESQHMSFQVTMQTASYECLLGLKFQQCIVPNGFARVSVCVVSMGQHSGYTSLRLQGCISLYLPPFTPSCPKLQPSTFGNPEWKEAESLGFRLRRSEFKFSSSVTSCVVPRQFLAFLTLSLPLCEI